MSLEPGTRLGPYEIQSALGAGGMGEVYKAHDTRLSRVVAIKTTRAAFGERFEREARAVSALNHPHICALYDIGEASPEPPAFSPQRAAGAAPESREARPPLDSGRQPPIRFLVMEYVEGASPAGPLPVATAVRYGIEIASALEAAHRVGIVHRDLKPANILVTKAGVKLLDFGLAKQMADSSAVDAAVTAKALTEAHAVIGTPQYMAPEQIEGRTVDARSDIFSFGCVLYEMLTGRRAFDGKSPISVMTAILSTEPPPMRGADAATPPSVERIVRRCLAKDPDERWQSAKDLAEELKWVATENSRPGSERAPAGGTEVSQAARRWPPRSGIVVRVAVPVLLAGFLLWWRSESAPGRRPQDLVPSDSLGGRGVAAPNLAPAMARVSAARRQLTRVDGAGRAVELLTREAQVEDFAVAPDEERVVAGIRDPSSGIKNLWLFDSRGPQGTRLTLDGADRPLWSRNGRQVYFSAAEGHSPRVVTISTTTQASFPLSGPASHFEDVTRDGRYLILKTIADPSEVWIQRTDDATEHRTLVKENAAATSPRVSPDGRWLAFTLMLPTGPTVFVQPFDRPGTRVPVSSKEGVNPIWRPDSRELYYESSDALMAVPVADDRGLVTAGIPRRLFAIHTQRVVRNQPHNVEVGDRGRQFIVNAVVADGDQSSKDAALEGAPPK